MSRHRFDVWGAWLLVLAAATSPALAQDLAVNGGFASDLSGWRVSGEGSAAISDDDVDGDPGSNSALLRNAEVGDATRTHPLDQCIVINAAGEYRFGASARVDAAQAAGRGVLGYVLYTGNACDTGIVGTGGRFIPRTTQWSSIEYVAQIHIASGTLLLRLGVDKPGAVGTLDVQVDDVYLIRGERLFLSGFE